MLFATKLTLPYRPWCSCITYFMIYFEINAGEPTTLCIASYLAAAHLRTFLYISNRWTSLRKGRGYLWALSDCCDACSQVLLVPLLHVPDAVLLHLLWHDGRLHLAQCPGQRPAHLDNCMFVTILTRDSWQRKHCAWEAVCSVLLQDRHC